MNFVSGGYRDSNCACPPPLQVIVTTDNTKNKLNIDRYKGYYSIINTINIIITNLKNLWRTIFLLRFSLLSWRENHDGLPSGELITHASRSAARPRVTKRSFSG